VPAVTVVRWTDALRFEATLPTGSVLALDSDPIATYRDGARDSSPDGTSSTGVTSSKPSQLLLAALAGCTGMDVVSICRKKRVTWTAYEVEVRGDQHDTHPRTWATIDVEHRFDGGRVDDVAVARAIHLSASRYCLVSAHLSAGDTTIHHRYRINDATGTRTGEVLVTGPFGAGLEPVEPTRLAPS
jgi:putative redox protein